jgi:hypothetical protein
MSFKLKFCLITLGICSVALLVTCTAISDSHVSPSKGQPNAEKGQQSQTASSVGQVEEDVAKLLARESSNLLILGTKLKVTPTYLWGDFNGDGAIDIAIVAALNASVNFNTQPLSAFVIDDALPPNDQGADKFPRESLKEYTDIPLLVIFHGANDASVKNFQIKERFIVLNVMDTPPQRMLLHKGRLEPAVAGDEPRVIPPPKPIGDAIVFLGDRNTGTAIFWYKGKYRWYPVNKYPPRKSG